MVAVATALQESSASPSDWKPVRLGQISSLITSGSRGWAAHYADAGALFVRSQNVRDGRLDFSDRQYVVPPPGAEGTRTRLAPGDVLITITGNSVGNVAWVDQDLGDAYISQHVGLVRLATPTLAPFVCRYLAPGAPGNPQIAASQSGQSKPGLNLKNLEDFLIALPHPAEASAIAAALSDVDALLGALDRLIAKKRDLKQAAMQRLLTGQTRLPGFSGKWETKRFSDVFTKVNAKAYQIQTTDYQPTGSLPVVDQGQDFIVGFSDRIDKRFRCPSGGVIVFGDHTCIVKYVDFDFVVGADGTQILAARASHSARFQALHLAYKGIAPTGYNRHFKFVKERDFAAPPLHEQDAIAAVLFDMQAEITVLEQRRDKTRLLKQGMMHELLTGRTRLL